MTPEQIALVQSSFAKVAPIQDQAAAKFYEHLFELDRSVRTLFKGDLEVQRRKLMAALRAVVGAFDRWDEIMPAVRELGRRRAHCGAQPEDCATVGAALIWTFEQGLGADCALATRRAWLKGTPCPMMATKI